MASEIAGLAPLCGYVKQENRVMPVRFAWAGKRSRQPEFIEREWRMPELRPLSPAPVAAQEPQAALEPVQPAAKTCKTPAVAAVLPAEMPPLAEATQPEKVHPQPRRSAFRKEEAAREWTPVD